MSECTHDCSTCSQSCGNRTEPESLLAKPHELSHIKKVIGVCSGKGGVGKSLVTSLLAVLAQRQGLKVGILDADITGPSIPKAFGIKEKAMGTDTGILPVKTKTGLANESAGALINRATQGLYPPGSTFKIVTLASALENLPDLNDFAFDCTGYYPVGNYSVTDGSAHGVQSLSDAFAHSCNTTFAALSQDLGYEMLGQTAEEMGFNENFMFSDLIVYNSSYPIDDLSAEDLAWSAIGQGRVLATPLHMALIASTIANRGVMNEPRLIAQVTTAQGGNRALLSHAGGRRVISEDVANRLESEMIRVVKSGTGKRAALDNGYTVAGKTGSAEASNDKSIESHAWFVGYITNDNAPYAVCVLVENGGSGGGLS